MIPANRRRNQRNKLQQNQDDSDGQTVDEEVPKAFLDPFDGRGRQWFLHIFLLSQCIHDIQIFEESQ